MACFVVPMAEAVVTTVTEKVLEKKAKKHASETHTDANVTVKEHKPFYKKLKWLNMMLWGGSALLLVEHIWHGEVTFAFPFFTALNEANGVMTVLHEMATAGVFMACLVTAIWGVMLGVSVIREKKANKKANLQKELLADIKD